MTKQEHAQEYYQRNKEKILEQCRIRYLENRERELDKRKKYYQKNKAKARARTQKQLNEANALFAQIKSNGCSICGYNTCLHALEFHHLDPSQKEHKLSQVRSKETILMEISKCILVCSNCHREIHAGLINNLQPFKRSGIEMVA